MNKYQITITNETGNESVNYSADTVLLVAVNDESSEELLLMNPEVTLKATCDFPEALYHIERTLCHTENLLNQVYQQYPGLKVAVKLLQLLPNSEELVDSEELTKNDKKN